jgi:YihY family inner membrane protein
MVSLTVRPVQVGLLRVGFADGVQQAAHGMIQRILRAIDRFQQRHPAIAFPLAVNKKFGDDHAGYLAALIAYYGFFSLFPLLLVLWSALGLLLRGSSSLQQSILNSALKNFPVIGVDIQKSIHSIKGSGLALGIGIAGTLWAGLGVTQAAQYAMNEIWDVPLKDRPNFLISRGRGLLLLAILGTITVAAMFASGVGGSGASIGLRVAGIALSLLLNLALFMLSFRVLTRRRLSWADVFPGAVTAAVLWTALQIVGGYYVTHQLKGASNVYGTFATVIGLLVWIYLGAQITLLCAEINVVKVRRLWPRSLVQPPTIEGDREVMRAAAEVQQRRPEETIEVSFRQGEQPSEEGRAQPERQAGSSSG